MSATAHCITLIADPEVLKIAVVENHEPFINLINTKDIIYGPSPEVPDNTNYTYMRQTVYEKLKQAQTQLPPGLHFCLYEAYRSLELQKQIFEELYGHIQTRNPDYTADELFTETIHLASPVINRDGSVNIPPHSTGAAIDVYLLDDAGNAVDMGIHPKDWMQDKGGILSLTASKAISAAAQNHRKIMSKVLANAGFVNYPTEYWHWSYGDKYWAYMENKAHAIYGSSAPYIRSILA